MNASVNTATKSGAVRSFSFAFVSEDLPQEAREQLTLRGLSVILLPAFSALDTPVSKHADMLLFPIGEALLTFEDYCRANARLFEGVKVITTDEQVGSSYPHDVLLNALDLAPGIICRTDSVSSVIRDSGKPLIHAAQGYARCTVCKVTDNAIITADPSITIAAKDSGIDVLQICGGRILLPGYSNGFIGGCSARIGDEMLFIGDITEHPDFESIDAFLSKYGVRPVSVCGGTLTDYGGIVLV